MAKIKNSIVKKMGFSIFLLVFIIFIAYYNFLNNQIKKYLEQQSKDLIIGQSQHLGAEIEMFLQKYIVIVDQAKNNEDFIKIAKDTTNRHNKREHPLYQDVTHQLESIHNLDKNISNAYIALEEASDLITNDYDYDADENYKLIAREWYIKTINEDKTIVATPYIDIITKKSTITIAAPIKDGERIIGAFGLDILIENINLIMSEYETKANTDIGLIYKTGQILYNSDYGNNIEPTDIFIQDLLDKNLVNKMLSGVSGIDQYTYQNNEKYIAYIHVDNSDMIVFTTILKSEALAQVNRFLFINLTILFILMITITISLLLLRNMFSKPFVKICLEMENYSSNKSISLPANYLERNDEIGILSKGIALMLDNINSNISMLEQKNQELLEAKEAVTLERLLFETTLHSLGDGVISTDKDGNIRIMNEIAEKLTGWTIEEAYGQPFENVFNIINEFTREKCVNPVKSTFETGNINGLDEHTILISKNGNEIPVEDSTAPIFDSEGNINGAVIVFRDYTFKKQKQAEILYLSYHDQLTGLHNRRYFEEQLKQLDVNECLPLSLLMLDVNGLKLTNDAFGHQVGDKLLKIVASTIKNHCKDEDIVARVGGDEFIMLLPQTNYEDAELIIKSIYRELEQIDFNDIVISVSIGLETKISMNQNIMEIYAKAEENMYRKKLIESQSMRSKTIQVILKTLNEANQRERLHSENVSKISRKIGEALNLDQEILREIEIAGLLHDIGKIAIDNNLLNKPGKLTNIEYDIIKRHTEIGYHILKSVDEYTNISDFVLSHHERWDGLGYPRGIKEDEILLIARIISVADSYEAMTSERTYKKTMSKEEAINELKRCAGTQFDPNIIKVFCEKVQDKI